MCPSDSLYRWSGAFGHSRTSGVLWHDNSVLLERRKQLHERIAAAIEALCANSIEDHLDELAHHYSRSGNVPKALEYHERAGQQAVQRSAYTDAMRGLTESNFDFYVCADQTTCTANYYGGTSFAAPMWAGYMALVNQQAVANGSSPLGFINPIIYTLGLGSSYGTDFHDITSGSNGYSAVTGYDLATGWGSPNGTGLINALAGISSSPDFTIFGSPTSVSVVQGNKGTSTITTVVSGGFNSAIALSATGQPTGITVTFNPQSIPAPGSGSSTMNITVASTTATGTYPITVTGTGGSTTHATTVTLTVAAAASADFTISASPTQITVARSHSGTSTIARVALNGFSSAITLSASGQGSSQNVSFGPNPIAASGSGTSTMTVTVGRRARVGAYTITLTGTGGGKTHTATVTLNVQ